MSQILTQAFCSDENTFAHGHMVPRKKLRSRICNKWIDLSFGRADLSDNKFS